MPVGLSTSPLAASFLGRAIAVFIIALPTAMAATENNELRLASDVWPPFTDIAGRTRIAGELVQEALERAGLKSASNIVDRTEVIPGLRERKLDGNSAI